MKTIVFTAQNFGFGPVSKCICISSKIENVKKIFFGSGVAYDYAMLYEFDEIYNYSHSNKNEIIAILKKADIFVNVMDFSLEKIIGKQNCYTIIIDSLLWFHSSKPYVDNVNIYFCQNFFFDLVEKKLQEFGIENAKIVGPIVNEDFEKKKKNNQCVVNFGGCNGEVEGTVIEIGKNSDYPSIILRVLLPILVKNFDKVIVTGAQKVMYTLAHKFCKYQKCHFVMLNHKEMLTEIYRSQVFFTVPGLQSLYDAFDKTPIFFLPPHSHSHHSNLEVIIRTGIFNNYFTWQNVYDFPIDNLTTRKGKVNLVLRTERIFSQDCNAQSFFVLKIQQFLSQKKDWGNITFSQKKIISRLGIAGEKAITKYIEQFLSTTLSVISHL